MGSFPTSKVSAPRACQPRLASGVPRREVLWEAMHLLHYECGHQLHQAYSHLW